MELSASSHCVIVLCMSLCLAVSLAFSSPVHLGIIGGWMTRHRGRGGQSPSCSMAASVTVKSTSLVGMVLFGFPTSNPDRSAR